MSDSVQHPYSLEIIESERSPGVFDWLIRKHGKLIQRSDRLHRSKSEAAKAGEKAIEMQFSDAQKMR